MPKEQEPIVLQLAPPPREQMGPFLLLGLEKDAVQEQIEANWARRVIWARRSSARVPLEDVNWAREVINDRDRRARADAASLNLDTSDRILVRLQERYGDGTPGARPRWEPRDVEKSLHDFRPPVEVPTLAEIQSAIPLPQVPEEVPAVRLVLEQLAQESLDPWQIPLELQDRSA
jgi:hypothetical protein